MNKKDIILFVSIFCILALIVGGTYAYWQWESGDNEAVQVVFNTIKDIDDYIYYDGGVSHFVGNFEPSGNHCGGKGNALEFYVMFDAPPEIKEEGILTATIKMDINNISDKIKSSGIVKWAVTEGNEADCSTTVSDSGVFNSTYSKGTTHTLKSGIVLTQESAKYTVWVWVDSSVGTTALKNLEGETLDVNIWTEINMSSVD